MSDDKERLVKRAGNLDRIATKYGWEVRRASDRKGHLVHRYFLNRWSVEVVWTHKATIKAANVVSPELERQRAPKYDEGQPLVRADQARFVWVADLLADIGENSMPGKEILSVT